ncbi:putative nucleoporin 98 [Tieghemostelium lacteum]|uniref:Putative nucleoporin 98 n=1 Tax=Tieghemostelium lacteum TaxID=361077 RepID=A0A151Z3N9_TIELA|nr:putative nucleoporin 98 [Tieghemostelium lacteum]|eukprot:KYQ88569.1 putative nucleoporin 98 [Tieghemostelium lacteum]
MTYDSNNNNKTSTTYSESSENENELGKITKIQVHNNKTVVTRTFTIEDNQYVYLDKCGLEVLDITVKDQSQSSPPIISESFLPTKISDLLKYSKVKIQYITYGNSLTVTGKVVSGPLPKVQPTQYCSLFGVASGSTRDDNFLNGGLRLINDSGELTHIPIHDIKSIDIYDDGKDGKVSIGYIQVCLYGQGIREVQIEYTLIPIKDNFDTQNFKISTYINCGNPMDFEDLLIKDCNFSMKQVIKWRPEFDFSNVPSVEFYVTNDMYVYANGLCISFPWLSGKANRVYILEYSTLTCNGQKAMLIEPGKTLYKTCILFQNTSEKLLLGMNASTNNGPFGTIFNIVDSVQPGEWGIIEGVQIKHLSDMEVSGLSYSAFDQKFRMETLKVFNGRNLQCNYYTIHPSTFSILSYLEEEQLAIFKIQFTKDFDVTLSSPLEYVLSSKLKIPSSPGVGATQQPTIETQKYFKGFIPGNSQTMVDVTLKKCNQIQSKSTSELPKDILKSSNVYGIVDYNVNGLTETFKFKNEEKLSFETQKFDDLHNKLFLLLKDIYISSIFGTTVKSSTTFGSAFIPNPQYAFGSQPQGTSSLFGTSQQGSTTPSFSLTTQQQPQITPSTSLFGQSSNTSSGSLFGQTSHTPSTGLFGQSSNTPSTSLFGQSSNTPTPSTSGSQPQSTSSLFGQSSNAPSTGLFGQSSNTPTPSTSGSQPQSTSSLFGQSSNTPSTSLFGQSSNTPSTSLFGQPSNTPSTSLFGQPSNTPSTSLFGQSSNTPSVFGSQPQTTSSLFGTPQHEPQNTNLDCQPTSQPVLNLNNSFPTFGGVGQPTAAGQIPFRQTVFLFNQLQQAFQPPATNETTYASITAHDPYQNKSFEELRLEQIKNNKFTVISPSVTANQNPSKDLTSTTTSNPNSTI